MDFVKLARLRRIALALMLPGLAGLIVSSMMSVHYLDTMPRWPSPSEMRTVPRNIHGVVVYQTASENRKLNIAEYTSVGVFLVGLVLGLVYLEKWGVRRTTEPDFEDELSEDLGRAGAH